MENKDKIILSLCSGTGAWERPYVEAGYNVISITLPEYDVRTYIPPKNIYGILAAPPCTHFSIARNDKTAKEKRNFRKGMEIVIACLNIIWECRYNNKLAFWCLENPTGFLRQFLGKPILKFNPCDYGDMWTKRTDLWGYFNTPKGKQIVLPLKNKELGYIKHINKNRSIVRSITPSGFARAFFESNK